MDQQVQPLRFLGSRLNSGSSHDRENVRIDARQNARIECQNRIKKLSWCRSLGVKIRKLLIFRMGIPLEMVNLYNVGTPFTIAKWVYNSNNFAFLMRINNL